MRRIDSLIERIVREQWPLRRVEQYGARVAGVTQPASGEDGDAEAGATVPAASRPGRMAGGPLFSCRDGRVVIDAKRLEQGEISPEERAQLIAVLEDLLSKTRHARLKL